MTMTPAEYGRWLGDQTPPLPDANIEAAARLYVAWLDHRPLSGGSAATAAALSADRDDAHTARRPVNDANEETNCHA